MTKGTVLSGDSSGLSGNVAELARGIAKLSRMYQLSFQGLRALGAVFWSSRVRKLGAVRSSRDNRQPAQVIVDLAEMSRQRGDNKISD